MREKILITAMQGNEKKKSARQKDTKIMNIASEQREKLMASLP